MFDETNVQKQQQFVPGKQATLKEAVTLPKTESEQERTLQTGAALVVIETNTELRTAIPVEQSESAQQQPTDRAAFAEHSDDIVSVQTAHGRTLLFNVPVALLEPADSTEAHSERRSGGYGTRESRWP